MKWPEFSIRIGSDPSSELKFKFFRDIIACSCQSVFFPAEEMANLGKIMRVMQKHCNASTDVDIFNWLAGKFRESGVNLTLEERVIVVRDFSWIFKFGDCLG